jgi:hypothetical protein
MTVGKRSDDGSTAMPFCRRRALTVDMSELSGLTTPFRYGAASGRYSYVTDSPYPMQDAAPTRQKLGRV